MQIGRVGRIVVAVVAGYTLNALLIAATEQLLLRCFVDTSYLVADVITQCFCQAASGYLCARMAGSQFRIAVLSLISLGLFVGLVSLTTSWHSEPHWYAIVLICVYAPCVWIGAALGKRAISR